MTEIVKKIAEEQGIDVVIDVTNTLYYKPTLEITPPPPRRTTRHTHLSKAMAGYLQNYGAGEEHRNRVVKFIILGVFAALILTLAAYLFLHDRSEKKTVEQFLAQINSHDYKDAYVTWGCTEAKPCRNYDYARFLEDWGPQDEGNFAVENRDGGGLQLVCDSKCEGRWSGAAIARRRPRRADSKLRAFS